eukprot:418426-Prorocentrum_minimum.AAC.1
MQASSFKRTLISVRQLVRHNSYWAAASRSSSHARHLPLIGDARRTGGAQLRAAGDPLPEPHLRGGGGAVRGRGARFAASARLSRGAHPRSAAAGGPWGLLRLRKAIPPVVQVAPKGDTEGGDSKGERKS